MESNVCMITLPVRLNTVMYLVMFVLWIQLLCTAQYVARDIVSSKSGNSPTKCNADAKEPWSYRERNGPSYWGNKYRNCSGQRQSPIAINSLGVIRDARLTQLSMNSYDIPVTRGTIQNDGRTIQITPADGVQRTIFVNGTTRNLTGLHFHWGDAYNRGAEHIINGIQHSMELHFVHQNMKKQTAVVAVFFQEQNRPNTELQKVVNRLSYVMYNGTKTQLGSRLNLNNLLPSNPSSFFRYLGSLTTPECDEGVVWSVLINPLPVGANQMAEFRKLYSSKRSEANSKCKLSNNYRPPQPLNYRPVFVSH